MGLHFADAAQQACALGLVPRLRQRVAERMDLVVHFRQAGDAAQRVLQQRFGLGIGLQVLADMADARRLFDQHVTGIGEGLVENETEKGRFAGAVGPDDADAFAFVDAERDVFKDDLRAVTHAYVAEFNHGCV